MGIAHTSAECPETDLKDLRQLMGSAFNPHFMAEKRSDFALSEMEDIDELEERNRLYSVFGISKKLHLRRKRSRSRGSPVEIFSAEIPLPWSCGSDIRWRNLGPDMYPRYVRDVQCGHQHSCWYGYYTCQPKYSSIRVLKRNRENCAPDSALPVQLRQQWIFEEVQITICCECGR